MTMTHYLHLSRQHARGLCSSRRVRHSLTVEHNEQVLDQNVIQNQFFEEPVSVVSGVGSSHPKHSCLYLCSFSSWQNIRWEHILPKCPITNIMQHSVTKDALSLRACAVPRKISTSMFSVSRVCLAVLPNFAPTFSQFSWTNLTILFTSSVTFLILYCCGQE